MYPLVICESTQSPRIGRFGSKMRAVGGLGQNLNNFTLFELYVWAYRFVFLCKDKMFSCLVPALSHMHMHLSPSHTSSRRNSYFSYGHWLLVFGSLFSDIPRLYRFISLHVHVRGVHVCTHVCVCACESELESSRARDKRGVYSWHVFKMFSCCYMLRIRLNPIPFSPSLSL